MRRLNLAGLVVATACLAAVPVFAAPQPLSPALQPLAFMVGHWTATAGKAEHDTIAKGTSSIEPTAGGTALLRRDHTELFSADGKPKGSFDQVMLIYPEGGELHADYFDGTHAIHYLSAKVEPGKSATFATAATRGPPRFRLTYAAPSPDAMTIRFEMAPPGADALQTIAEGAVKRD